MAMDGRVKILQDNLLYKGWSTLRQYVLSYTRRDGNVEFQTREIYDSGDGAAVLLYNPVKKNIILIRQFRLAVLLNSDGNGFILECPAGMLDDLHPEETIIKEIKEETGYVVTDVTKIFETFATPGAHREKIHLFVARYDSDQRIHQGGGDVSEQEDIEVLEYSYDQIPVLLQNGSIIDSKTIILLQWVQLHVF